jgi:hypothetical protein
LQTVCTFVYIYCMHMMKTVTIQRVYSTQYYIYTVHTVLYTVCIHVR